MGTIDLILLLIIIVIGVFLIYKLSKNITKGSIKISGVKLILVGINLSIVSGIIILDSTSYLAGVEYVLLFLGLFVSLIGLIKKD